MEVLAEKQEASQHNLDVKLKRLQQDVTAAQEEATERALKRTKRDCSTDFKKKGHQEQFKFSEVVED